jgi:hypothetical protein
MPAEPRVGPPVWEVATVAEPAETGVAEPAETEVAEPAERGAEASAEAEADQAAQAAGVATPEELRTEPAAAAPAVHQK